MTRFTFLAALQAFAMATTLAMLPAPASAALCSLANPGDQCVINFDASGAGVGPFDRGTWVYSSDDPFVSLAWAWFDDLDALGTPVASGGPSAQINFDAPPPNAAVWDDGRASVLLSFGAPLQIFDFSIRFIDSRSTTFNIAGTVAAQTVPTPASLPLLAVAMVAAFAATRRKPQPPRAG